MPDGGEEQPVPPGARTTQALPVDRNGGDPGRTDMDDVDDDDRVWANELLRCLHLSDDRVLNTEPLGRAGEGREFSEVRVDFKRLRRGQKYLDENVGTLKLALVINTHAILAYGDAAGDCVLEDHTAKALRQVPVLSDKAYRNALARLTRSDSVAIQEIALREEVRQAIADGCQVQQLERLLRIRKVLRKGLKDARLMSTRHQCMKRENLLKHRKPGRDVQYRTFTPFLLRDPDKFFVEDIAQLCQDPDAVLYSSAVEPNELWIMAFHGQINAASIYIDFDFMADLLKLTVYAGAFALGARQTMSEPETQTYRKMLCEGGEDTKPAASRPGRARYAKALRHRWRETPGLVEATEPVGRVARDD